MLDSKYKVDDEVIIRGKIRGVCMVDGVNYYDVVRIDNFGVTIDPGEGLKDGDIICRVSKERR